jgi:transposase
VSETKKGRKPKANPIAVAAWRQARNASALETAKRFDISEKTVRNYCRDFGDAARASREQWRIEHEIREAEQLDYAIMMHKLALRLAKEAQEEFERDPSWHNFFAAQSAAFRLVPREFHNKKPTDW